MNAELKSETDFSVALTTAGLDCESRRKRVKDYILHRN